MDGMPHYFAPSTTNSSNAGSRSLAFQVASCAITFFCLGFGITRVLADNGNVLQLGLSRINTASSSQPQADVRLTHQSYAVASTAAQEPNTLSRRDVLALTTTAGLLSQTDAASAVQGITPGRIPGFGPVDERGFRQYRRPEGKSGGHGVGWSEIPSYSFDLPASFKEIAVSIADLGGTEIDARFKSEEQGDVTVIVAPVLRFKDVGYNARVTLDSLGTPERMILAFGPEIMGTALDEDNVISMEDEVRDGLLYYQYEVRPRTLVSMTATGNRLYVFIARATPRQWSKSKEDLRTAVSSFRVPKVE